MALLEDTLGGWTGGILVGLGAALVGPSLWPAAGSVVRPVAGTLVRGVLLIADGLQGAVAGVTEQMSDLIAEARAESTGAGNGARVEKRRAARHR